MGIFSYFDDFKILAKVPHPIVKFNEKHDGEVAVSVLLIVLELGQIFCQNVSQST